jgi:uncharacterized protein YoxC
MRFPKRDGDWQLIISFMVLAFSIVLLLVAEAKNRQAEAILKEAKQTIKEVCR